MRRVHWIVIVLGLVLGLLVVGSVGAQSSTTCVTIGTYDSANEGHPTTLLLEQQDGDFADIAETTDDSNPDGCASEELDDYYIYDAPPGEYIVHVRNDESPVYERWGAFEVTVGDVDEETFIFQRAAPYHTDVGFNSPRDTHRFEPGERADFEGRVYNAEDSGSRDVTTEVYVYPKGSARPDTPTQRLSSVNVYAGNHATIDGSIPMPDSEGEYVVDVEFVTDFGFGEFTSDYVKLGTVTVESFEPPQIDDSSPSDSTLRLATDDSTTFTVAASDPDTADSSLAYTWFVDGQEITSGAGFTLDASRYQGGEHEIAVTVSDGNDLTNDAVRSWTAEIVEPPTINSVSPGNIEVTRGVPVTFTADATDPGGYTPLNYEWSIDGRSYNGKEVTETFTSTGETPVTLRVVNSQGVETTQTYSVDVEAVPPTISEIDGEGAEIDVGDSMTLFATASDPADRDLAFDYDWRALGKEWNGQEVTISPRQVGQHNVDLTVTNEYGASTSQSITLTVLNDKPKLEQTSSQDETVSITAGQSERFSVKVEDEDASPTSISFAVDGDRIATKDVTQTIGQVSFTHQFEDPGPHTVQITAADGHGQTNSVRWDVNVESRPPVFNNWTPEGSSLAIKTGEVIEFDVAASDPDGQSLSYEWFVDDEYEASGTQFSKQFQRNGDYSVRVVASDPDGKTRERVWDVSVDSFNESPIIDDQISAVTLDSKNETEFATLSLRNPDINERPVRVEMILKPPNGLTVESTHNVESGSASQYSLSESVKPGTSASISARLRANDISELQRSVDVDYAIIYYPEDERNDSSVFRNATQEITIARPESDENSGQSPTQKGTETEENDEVSGQTVSAEGPGFTAGLALLSMLISLGYLLNRRDQ